jgi:hypothetical protein
MTGALTITRMGSSGSKRKGRQHLPKVGTPANNQHELQARRERALHPFSEDPSARKGGASSQVMAVIVAVVLAVGAIAIMIAT